MSAAFHVDRSGDLSYRAVRIALVCRGLHRRPAAGLALHGGAVAAAETKGRDEGAKAANDRLGAILGAEGIKGDGPRMAAALDLAMKSPDMKAEDVTAFVTGNLPAASAPDKETDADQYERDRVAAAGLSAPVAPDRQQKKGGLSGLVDAHVARVNAS